jgi:hypothetical protein
MYYEGDVLNKVLRNTSTNYDFRNIPITDACYFYKTCLNTIYKSWSPIQKNNSWDSDVYDLNGVNLTWWNAFTIHMINNIRNVSINVTGPDKETAQIKNWVMYFFLAMYTKLTASETGMRRWNMNYTQMEPAFNNYIKELGDVAEKAERKYKELSDQQPTPTMEALKTAAVKTLGYTDPYEQFSRISMRRTVCRALQHRYVIADYKTIAASKAPPKITLPFGNKGS